MAKILTNEEVANQWYQEHPGVVALPSPEDIKRMRATMNKRAERARKKAPIMETPVPITTQDALGIIASRQPAEESGAEVVPEGFVHDIETTKKLFDVSAAPAPYAAELGGEEVVIEPPAPVKKRFVMVPVLSGGQPLPEVKVDCFSEKEANKLVWAGLSDAQKDNCEYIDWVETEDIPTTTAAKVVAEVVESVVAAAIAKDGPLLGDVQIKQEVTPVANKKAAKKAGKRTPREEIVKSAAFIALFEKAIAASRDPKRTHCKNGHTITAAHAHVGDLKRTGRYTCDPCNQDAQAKYNAGK